MTLYVYAKIQTLISTFPFFLSETFFSENSAITIKKGLLQQKACGKTQKKKSDDENETASTQQGHDEQLKKEMAARKPDDKKIFALLKVSLQTRRKWIDGLAGKGTVKKVLKEYPGFRNYKQVSANLTNGCPVFPSSDFKVIHFL